MSQEDERFVSAKELAERWGTTEKTLATDRYNGDGPPYYRLGKRRIRYKLSDILAYEQAGATD